MGALEGRVAVITGAGRGMGREHARLFGAEGAALVVNDTGAERDGTGTDPKVIEAVAAELRDQGTRVVASTDDVTTLDGVHSYRQPAGYFPLPGGTFAGVSLPGPITWTRSWIDRTGQLVMDLGRGESVALRTARTRP